MRSSTQSEVAALAHQASLKGSEGPALVVFSGGTAFNSVAGETQNSSGKWCYLNCMQDVTASSFNGHHACQCVSMRSLPHKTISAY